MRVKDEKEEAFQWSIQYTLCPRESFCRKAQLTTNSLCYSSLSVRSPSLVTIIEAYNNRRRMKVHPLTEIMNLKLILFTSLINCIAQQPKPSNICQTQ